MPDQIVLTHIDDPTIEITLARPSRAAYADLWDDMVPRRGSASFTAYHNLVLACSDNDARLPDLLADEWSGAPLQYGPALFLMAGHFSTAGKSADDGEIIDLVALYDVAAKAGSTHDARIAKHWLAMSGMGVTVEMLGAWLKCRNPKISRACVRLPNGGYYVARGPRIADRAAAGAVFRAPASEQESGPYAAAVRLVIDCEIWSGPRPIDKMIDDFPGYATKLNAIIEDLNTGYQAVEKK